MQYIPSADIQINGYNLFSTECQGYIPKFVKNLTVPTTLKTLNTYKKRKCDGGDQMKKIN